MELSMIIASIARRFDFELEYPGQIVSFKRYFCPGTNRPEFDVPILDGNTRRLLEKTSSS